MPTRDDVLGQLRGVIDPELGGNIVDLGMVPDVSVSPDGDVVVTAGQMKLQAGTPLVVNNSRQRIRASEQRSDNLEMPDLPTKPEAKSATESVILLQKADDVQSGRKRPDSSYPYLQLDYDLPFTHIGTDRQLFVDNFIGSFIHGSLET